MRQKTESKTDIFTAAGGKTKVYRRVRFTGVLLLAKSKNVLNIAAK